MIIQGRDTIENQKEKNSHGGVGKYEVRTMYDSGFDSSMRYIREIILHAGSTIGPHLHEGDEEIYYFTSGEGEMIVDDEKQQIKPGDTVLTKSGSRHGLNNTSDQELKFFVVCAKVA